MSRFIKSHSENYLKASTMGVSIPSGGTADRSVSPRTGDIRFNTDTSAMELYNGSSFVSLSIQGTATITQDSFTGDGSTVAFTMSTSVTSNQTQRIVVAVGNVYQNPASAYTLSGTTITFTSPPGAAETITIVHGYDSTTGV